MKVDDKMKRTPLYEFHVSHGARLIPFSGWEMPVQYTSILEEHRAVRETAGLFDVSHMGEINVNGKDAEAFLDYMMTNDISKLKEGRALYTIMCYPDGGCVDDLLVYRLKRDSFLLCVNASNIEKDFDWLGENKNNFECAVENVSESYGQLALQGPKSVEILSRLVEGVDEVKRFGFIKVNLLDKDVLISRTGYTGEDGFEIYCSAEDSPSIAEAIMAKGETFGLKLAGLGARDSLRLEAGYPLYGHEISKEISPLEAGLGFAVKLGKGCDFIGKIALQKQKEEGLSRTIVHFKLDSRRIARQEAKVFSGEACIGEVVSGTLSPVLNQPIGSALVKKGFEQLEADVRGDRIPLLIVKTPLI